LRTTWIFVGLTGAFTAAAGASHYGHAASGLTFALSTVALAGLAWIVSFSTEQVGERFGPGVTGVMQSTLGNLPEFFVVVFALSQGELVVAQTSIIGSVFANALLVLGLVIIAGCSKSSDGLMRFSVRLPKDNAILLMLASFLIVILGISSATGDRASHHVEAISIAGAVALLLTYLVWIVAYLRSDTPGEPSHAEPALPLTPALVLVSLLFTTHLTFALAPVFIGALLLTSLALWFITSDGEATMFEGVALISLYAILAVVTFYE
jgi:Ca2+:H+ antiporter